MLTCVNPTLDRPVILFQDVIKILNRSVLTVLLQNAISFELNDGWWISSVLVDIDLITRGAGWLAPPRAFARKRLAAAASCLAERRKSRVAPVESIARYR